MTGVDFSHFNLAMRCLASGGGGGGGCWGCIERPSYIHLSPPTRSPPSLSRRFSRPLAPSSFPLFPPTFVAFHPFQPPFPTFSASSTFSSSTSSYGFTTHLPPRLLATSRLSFATHLPEAPFLGLLSPSSFSQPRHPSALFLAASVSRRLTLPFSLTLGLYLEMLPPTNKPQTLCSFTQS